MLIKPVHARASVVTITICQVAIVIKTVVTFIDIL
jgi:hypothetical protein